MNVYYYWYKDVKDANAKLDPLQYDINKFFDKMLYSKDRWSWMTDGESYLKSEEGTITGTYGVSISQPIKYYGDYDIKCDMSILTPLLTRKVSPEVGR